MARAVKAVSDRAFEIIPKVHAADLPKAKKARQEEQDKKDANDQDIAEFFTRGATKAQPKVKVHTGLAAMELPVQF